MNKGLQPKLLTTLKGYSRQQFIADVVAGIIVGIVALPLAIAFGIASGVSPEQGIITAVVGGFLVSALGGSRVQIGGPTGAFIVIVYGIVQKYGPEALGIATLMAGIMLIGMGLARLGGVIKFIPYPVIVGFTSGIAVIIFSSQIKDFFGLQTGPLPPEFFSKWEVYVKHIDSFNIWSFGIAAFSVALIQLWPRISRKIPGSLVAIVLTTVFVQIWKIPVDTIGSKFGHIASSIPNPSFPAINLSVIRELIRPAFTIALLGAIESLLSAVVADGMIGGKHRSNMELIAQGVANIFSPLFSGIPVTGAIARTATNIRNGGRTPISGIVHSIVLLLILLFFGKWAILIPMSCLAGILVIVSYNMSEWRSFKSLTKGPKSDVVVLLVTFFLTVFLDLTVAIEIGMVMAMLLFMRRMALASGVSFITTEMKDTDSYGGKEDLPHTDEPIPRGIEMYEINGPFFFGIAHKFEEAVKVLEAPPKVRIIVLEHVPFIDSTGLHSLDEFYKKCLRGNIKMLLCNVRPEVLEELLKAEFLEKIGPANILPDRKTALDKAKTLVS